MGANLGVAFRGSCGGEIAAWRPMELQGGASLPCSIYQLSYETQLVPAMLQGCNAERGSILQVRG